MQVGVTFGVTANHLKGRQYGEKASGMFHNTCLRFVICCFRPNGHPLVIFEQCLATGEGSESVMFYKAVACFDRRVAYWKMRLCENFKKKW